MLFLYLPLDTVFPRLDISRYLSVCVLLLLLFGGGAVDIFAQPQESSDGLLLVNMLFPPTPRIKTFAAALTNGKSETLTIPGQVLEKLDQII